MYRPPRRLLRLATLLVMGLVGFVALNGLFSARGASNTATRGGANLRAGGAAARAEPHTSGRPRKLRRKRHAGHPPGPTGSDKHEGSELNALLDAIAVPDHKPVALTPAVAATIDTKVWPRVKQVQQSGSGSTGRGRTASALLVTADTSWAGVPDGQVPAPS